MDFRFSYSSKHFAFLVDVGPYSANTSHTLVFPFSLLGGESQFPVNRPDYHRFFSSMEHQGVQSSVDPCCPRALLLFRSEEGLHLFRNPSRQIICLSSVKVWAQFAFGLQPELFLRSFGGVPNRVAPPDPDRFKSCNIEACRTPDSSLKIRLPGWRPLPESISCPNQKLRPIARLSKVPDCPNQLESP